MNEYKLCLICYILTYGYLAFPYAGDKHLLEDVSAPTTKRDPKSLQKVSAGSAIPASFTNFNWYS